MCIYIYTHSTHTHICTYYLLGGQGRLTKASRSMLLMMMTSMMMNNAHEVSSGDLGW